ncbi:DUF6888 family protein [Phormidesmis sp. 146-12]
MRSSLLPTPAQTLECFRVCQELTNMFLPIYLVRLDLRDNKIAILAGETIEITINRNGETEFP